MSFIKNELTNIKTLIRFKWVPFILKLLSLPIKLDAFSQPKRIYDQTFSLGELKNSFKHMNASSNENRDNLWSSRDTGYTFVILPLVPDRLYIERGRGDWAGTGRFRHWNEKVMVKWHQTGSRLNDFYEGQSQTTSSTVNSVCKWRQFCSILVIG